MQRTPGELAAGTHGAPAVRARGGRGNPHVAGNPVGGSAAFVGREDVLRTVVRALAEPQNQGIVLYGQRRIGKTSILQHLEVTLPERSGHRPVFFDLQDKAASSLDEVLEDLASKIAHALGLPEPVPGPNVERWFRDTWLPSVLDGLPAGVSLVPLFDEFDVLADGQAKQAASALFPYLRRLLEKNAPRFRAVFVIGRNIDDLENVAHALFKGLPSCQVSLLDRKDAELLVRLGEGNGSLTWSAEAVEAAWALTHGHPLLLQALCGHVWFHAHEERQPEDAGRAVTAMEVEEAVELTLSGSRPAFEWLWKGLPPGKRVVAAALAQAGPEAISEEVLHRVLNEKGMRVIIRELREAPRMLIEWDLLEEPAKGLYQFRVELLRLWIARFKPLDQVQQDLDQIEPTAELLYRAAEGMYRAGNLDSAMARLQETLGLNPNHVRASELLADILISRHDWAAARTVLERLYENQPAVGRARLVQVVLAQAEAAQGEEEQLELFQRAREAEKNAKAIEGIRRIWKARGDLALARGDLEVASTAYRAGGLAELEAEVARELRRITLATALKTLAFGASVLAAIVGGFIFTGPSARNYRDVADYVQAVVAAIIFARVSFFDRAPSIPSIVPEPDRSACKRVVKQFTEYWSVLWFGWVGIYAFHSVEHLVHKRERAVDMHALSQWMLAYDVIDNVQNATLLALFLVMFRPTLDPSAVAHRRRRRGLRSWGLFFLLSAVQALLVGFGEVHGSLLTTLWPCLLSGVAASACLGLFIGRLESRFLEVYGREILALYFYAAIQPLFSFVWLSEVLHSTGLATPLPAHFETEFDAAQMVLKLLALVLKLLLYLIVRRQLTSGRLAFYMWKTHLARETLPGEWKKFNIA